MDDEGYIILIVLLVITLILSFTGFLSAVSDTERIGQMICDERGYGEFKTFHNYTNTIVCYPKEAKEKYDGGYIKVVR